MKQLEVLNEYYTNLYYDIDKEKTLKLIDELSKTVELDESVNISERLKVLTNIIQDNISSFKCICRHVDMIDNILEYLSNAIDMLDKETSETDHKMFFGRMIFTVYNIYNESSFQSLLSSLLQPICTNLIDQDTYQQMICWQNSIGIGNKNISFAMCAFCSQKICFYYIIKNFRTNTHAEHIYTVTQMVILEDSDLYAVVSDLIVIYTPFCKVWVQEQVKEKFVWLIKKHSSDITANEDLLHIIHTFQSLKDVQIKKCENNIYIVSVWSEDILAAKNLALSLNSDVIFINTCIDFSGGLLNLPYKEIIEQEASQQTLNKIRKQKSDSNDTEQSINVVHLSHIAEMNFTSICNLFYDGTWQEPVKGLYWKHNDNLWANATDDDIIRCYESAEKGFKTWSINSLKTRTQILSKLASTLKLTGKPVLAVIVIKWLKVSYLFETIEGYSKINRNGMIEVMHVRTPVGVIILREKNENVLFFRLMQTLIAGNSIIVMFDENFCDLTSFCDMFSTCGIPPGVINLLSHEDTNMLEHKLCSAKYTDYADKIFVKGNSSETYIKTYKNLTTCKSIVLPLT